MITGICDVAIHPEYQGLGLGRDIIQKLIQLSKSHKKLFYMQTQAKKVFIVNWASSK